MVLCGTKNGSSMASLEKLFEEPLCLRVYRASRRFKSGVVEDWDSLISMKPRGTQNTLRPDHPESPINVSIFGLNN